MVNLQGSKETFTLKKYKEDLETTYSRRTLFLCPMMYSSESDHNLTTSCWSDHESDDWLSVTLDTDDISCNPSRRPSCTETLVTLESSSSGMYILAARGAP